MKLPKPEGRAFGPSEEVRSLAARAAAVILGAAALSWPAFYNRFPLLYADSMTYLDQGRIVARALFLRQFSDYYGVRSLFYSLGILPFHWNRTPWPVVALQSLLVAWVLWLVARSIAPLHAGRRYPILVLSLSLLTGVSWYASFIMPDILGPLAYLSIYLLVFAPHTLTRAERIFLYLIAWWGVTSHATHLLLAGGLCALLAVFVLFERPRSVGRLRAVAEASAIVLLAAAAQLALNAYLYGKPSLNGQRPPYLTARLLTDGPGRWYLERNCGREHWAVCGHLQGITADPDSFLWGPDAPYETASEDERRQIEAEEMPFVLATLRTYPRQQLLKSAANFRDQLFAFGLYGFDSSEWMLAQFDDVMPAARSSYLVGRQARDALPLDLWTDIQFWTVVASLGVIAGLVPLLWRRHSPRLAGLGLVVAATVVANAGVTGVLSVVDDRYQCRVIWMIPLLAGVCFLDWLEQRGMRAESRIGAGEHSEAAAIH